MKLPLVGAALLALSTSTWALDVDYLKQIEGPIVAIADRVIDGDTFVARVFPWPREVKHVSVRIIGIDTPELKGRCDEEKALARVAKAKLEELVSGKIVKLYYVKFDTYPERVDALVMLGTGNVATDLISAGVARAYDGKSARKGWC